MELTELRRIKNLGKKSLPGFEDGIIPPYLSNGADGVGMTNRTWYNTPALPTYIPVWRLPNTPSHVWNDSFQKPDGGFNMPTPIKMLPATGVIPTTENLGISNNSIDKLQSAKPKLNVTTNGSGTRTVNTTAIPMAIPAVIGAGADIVDAHTYGKSTQNLLDEAGRRLKAAMGVGYEWLNDPEYQRELAEVRRSGNANTLKALGSGAAAGAAIGSIIPGLGTLAGGAIGGIVGAVGGLFGGASRKRKAEEKLRLAEINAKVRNDFNRDDALTLAIRLRNAQEIGNPFASAYRYANGKTPVYSALGLVNGAANSRVSNGELIVNFDDGYVFEVPGKPNNKDTKYARLKASDGIIPNKHGLAAYAKETGDYVGAMKMTDMFLKQKDNMAKNGKLPHFAGGLSPLTNIIPSVFGGLASVYQYFDAKNQSIKSPSIYASNPYALDAFAALNELKNNPYPTLSQLREAEARTRNALESSGGLGAGLRMLARIAQQGVTQNAWAKSLADTQAYNNAQRAAVANARLNTGNQDATRMQQANAFNEEYTAKSHAARRLGMQTGIYNFKNMLDTYYANRFREYMGAETLGLYKQNQALDLARFNRDVEAAREASTRSTVPMNVADYYNNMMKAYLASQGYRV